MYRNPIEWMNPIGASGGSRVAAVNPRTYMIEHIYKNCIEASKYHPDVTAQEIAKAMNNFHLLAGGYFWKRIE